MTRLAGTARWTAIAIALAAIVDPAVPWPGRVRPALRLAGPQSPASAQLTRELRHAGFTLDPADEGAAVVLAAEAPGAAAVASRDLSLPVWVLDTGPRAPNIRIVAAAGPASRLPGQAIEVRVAVEASGLDGKRSDLVLEDGGIAVATAPHTWDGAVWRTSLQYLPPGGAGGRLRVHAVPIAGETAVDDNAAEIAVPPVRGPLRTLVLEAEVTWPAMFARRALEGDPAFAVAAVQRPSPRVATRAGTPPSLLTRAAVTPFEVVLVGAPDSLAPAELDVLRWFVEARGGIAVLIPDRPPTGRYLELLGDRSLSLEARATEAPSSLGGSLVASELLIARHVPAAARTFAATGARDAVVWSCRRGAGAVIFSGALDAWRYRAQDDDGFARFWRRAIAGEAAAVPPLLEVSVEPRVVAAGEPARVRARLRATELSAGTAGFDLDAVTARAVSPAARIDTPVRLWPTAEPGTYEGEWRPAAAGEYNLAVTAGSRRGDAPVIVAAAVPHGSRADAVGLSLLARTSGGRVFPQQEAASLVDALKTAYPPRAVMHATYPMRSPWWVVPFAGLLCAEWAVRRGSGRR